MHQDGKYRIVSAVWAYQELVRVSVCSGGGSGVFCRGGAVAGMFAVIAAAGTAYGDVDITVLAGAGGYVRQHAMTPVQVILGNDETERAGQVAVAFTQGGTASMWATRSVELPPNARKRVFLYLPMDRLADQIIVRYQTRRGRRIAEIRERLSQVAARLPVVCAVGRFPPGLPPVEVDNERVYTRLVMRPDQLPDRCEGLEMFDVVLISPAPYMPLSRVQVDALRGWVLRGGTLIVDASQPTDAFRSGTFEALLPYSPLSRQEAPLDLFGGETMFSTGRTRRGQVVLSSNEWPLAVRANYGLGSVACIAVDPTQPAFTMWGGSEAFWRDLMGRWRMELPAQPDGMFQAVGASFGAGSQTARILSQFVSHQPRTGVRLGLVLLLTVLYALAVGPGDYWLVKRLGRPQLTWATFPAIVAVFTAAAYGAANAWLGGTMTAAHFTRLLILPDLDTAVRCDVTGLFVPRVDDYVVGHVQRGLLRPIDVPATADDLVTIDHDTGRLVHRIPIWARRTYRTSYETAEYPPIEVYLGREAGDVVATIANHSDLTLRGGKVARGTSVWSLGSTTIGPGTTTTVPLYPSVTSRHYADTREIRSSVLNHVLPGTADGREFDLRDALDRGATVFTCSTAGTAGPRCPLVVNEEQRDETGRQTIQVLTYRGGSL